MRGAICERFGWTLHYLTHEIPWLDVHYMMIDAPRFVPNKAKNKEVTGNTSAITPEASTEPKTKAEKLNGFLNKWI